MKLDADITVLVMSCDAYQDLWNPFFFYFHKHWPFQDTPILLVTDTIAETGNDSVRAVPIQGSWSTRLCGALRQVKTHYILLLLEDYFLSGPIDAVTFRQAVADCAKYHAATIRLLPGMKKFLTPPVIFFLMRKFLRTRPIGSVPFPAFGIRRT